MSVITITTTTVPNWQRGGTTCTLRIAANVDFLTSDGTPILSGHIDHGVFYQIVSCTISGTTVTIPEFDIDSTTDSSDPNATYTAVFFDENDARADTYWANYLIPSTFGLTSTHAQIHLYNAVPRGIQQYGYPNIEVVQQMIREGVLSGTGSLLVTLTDAATVTVDASLSNLFEVTLGGNRILGNPTGAFDRQLIEIQIEQDGAGGRTLTLDTKYTIPAGRYFTLSTAPNAVDYIWVVYDLGRDKFDVVAFKKGFV